MIYMSKVTTFSHINGWPWYSLSLLVHVEVNVCLSLGYTVSEMFYNRRDSKISLPQKKCLDWYQFRSLYRYVLSLCAFQSRDRGPYWRCCLTSIINIVYYSISNKNKRVFHKNKHLQKLGSRGTEPGSSGLKPCLPAALCWFEKRVALFKVLTTDFDVSRWVGPRK